MTWDELRKLIEGKGSEVSMICKNCKHWERSPGVLWAVSDTEELRRDDVGQCWKASQKNPLVYAYGPDDDGQLYTGETFSCAAFEHGAQEARAIEIRPGFIGAGYRPRNGDDNDMDYIKKIAEIGACPEAVAWLRAENHPTLQEAWDACERGDWMLWLLRQTVRPDADKLPYVRVAAACARMSLEHYEDTYPDDDRPRKAIDAAERYAEEPSDENRIAAAAAARAAIDAANAAAAAAENIAFYSAVEDAAYAAVDAADAAAYAVAYAANAAYAAADAVARAAAEDAAYAELAEIVRRHFPTCPGLGG